MKSKPLTKQAVLIAVCIIFAAIFAACSTEANVQAPTESASNQETYEPEYQEISIEPPIEYEVDEPETHEPEADEPEEEPEILDSDSDQQAEEEPPQPPTEVTSMLLTEARIESLTSFFAEFGGWFGASPTLGDYDVASLDSIYSALEFVLSSRVFTHGREGILGYPHYGFVQYKGGQRFSWDDMPDGVWPAFEFVTSDYVDSVLWSLFGITGFRHGVSQNTPTFGFQYYYGGYYYRALAQGGGDMAVIEIAALYDNGNGTYSVVVEYIWAEPECCCTDWETPDPVHMQYNIAVIQPFADTYQMLYWRNNVPRDTPMPVREPTS